MRTKSCEPVQSRSGIELTDRSTRLWSCGYPILLCGRLDCSVVAWNSEIHSTVGPCEGPALSYHTGVAPITPSYKSSTRLFFHPGENRQGVMYLTHSTTRLIHSVDRHILLQERR